MQPASDLSTRISEEGRRRICFGAGWLTSSLRPVNSWMAHGERPRLKCRLYIILCEHTRVSGVLRWHFVVCINRVSRSEPSAPLTHLTSTRSELLKYWPVAVCLNLASASTSYSGQADVHLWACTHSLTRAHSNPVGTVKSGVIDQTEIYKVECPPMQHIASADIM